MIIDKIENLELYEVNDKSITVELNYDTGERLNLNIESIEIPNQPLPADMLYIK